MTRWILVLLLAGVVAAAASACSSSKGGCDPACATGSACITGAVCAKICDPDAGVAGSGCPAGQSCTETSAYCEGTACSAAIYWVCK